MEGDCWAPWAESTCNALSIVKGSGHITNWLFEPRLRSSQDAKCHQCHGGPTQAVFARIGGTRSRKCVKACEGASPAAVRKLEKQRRYRGGIKSGTRQSGYVLRGFPRTVFGLLGYLYCIIYIHVCSIYMSCCCGNGFVA